jgi:KipI family sensor histidine kinase inhibitor
VQRSDVLVQIPVRYDGEDLAEVAQILGITAEEVVRRHTGSEWSVAFTGFAPGFAYLSGGDPIFNVPRRATPRTKVPAGAVALAGSFSAVYPQASPGGWQIIGVTDAAMWDLARDLPACCSPAIACSLSICYAAAARY